MLVVNKLKTTGTAPTGRIYSTAVTVGTKIVIFGGQKEAFEHRKLPFWFSDVHVFDTVDKSWTKIDATGDIPAGRGAPTACL